MDIAPMPDWMGVPVTILLPNGARRSGWHRGQQLYWKELAAHDDLDEFGEPEGWYWAHAGDRELEWGPINA